jgi:hypothetical protein
MASAAVFAIRRCCGRPAAVSLTVLVTAAVVSGASAIVAVVTTDHVLFPRVCVLQRLGGRLLNSVSICSPRYAVTSGNMTRRLSLQANVSSIFTISLALVSINPHLLLRAHSRPVRLLTTRLSFRSHLLPATIFTGAAFMSLPPLTPRSIALWFSSMRFSSSMSIMSMK